MLTALLSWKGIVTAVGAVATAVGGWFAYARQRDAEENAPDMKANKLAQDDQKELDADEQAIAKGDLKQVQKKAAD